MNILVVTTGGTIGSSFDETAVNVTADGVSPVIEKVKSERSGVSFQVMSPLNILSETVSQKDLETLSECLYAVDFSAFDGVILTCGSDTLAYLASFLGLLFGGVKKPFALVAANKILDDPGSNGFENFSAAVGIIESGFEGVFVPYRNTDGVMYVHSATELRQADFEDDFSSFGGAFARYDGGLHLLREYTAQTIPQGVFDRKHPPVLKNRAAVLNPYPMLSYDGIDASRYHAFLHTLYHSGTLDAENAEKFIRKIGEKPFFICPLMKGKKPYQTTVDVLKAGAKPLFDIAPECAYMKLLLAVNQTKMSVVDFMK